MLISTDGHTNILMTVVSRKIISPGTNNATLQSVYMVAKVRLPIRCLMEMENNIQYISSTVS
jgi:hypothetical protein